MIIIATEQIKQELAVQKLVDTYSVFKVRGDFFCATES